MAHPGGIERHLARARIACRLPDAQPRLALLLDPAPTLRHGGGVADRLNQYNHYLGDPNYLAQDLSRYDKTFQVNLRGPLFWCQAVWEQAMKDKPGVMINIASVETGDMTNNPDSALENNSSAAVMLFGFSYLYGTTGLVKLDEIGDGITLLWEPYVIPLMRCNIWHVRGRDRDLLFDSGLGHVSLKRYVAREVFAVLPQLGEQPLVAVA